MRALVSVFSVLLVSHGGSALDAQTLTYSLAGEITSVPPCVEEVFSPGDAWTLEQVVDLALLAAAADDADDAETETTDEDAAAEVDDTDPEGDVDEDVPEEDVPEDEELPPTPTRSYRSGTFSWTIGEVTGTTRGVTRVFVSDNHLDQDSIAWQALDYSAVFTPSGFGGTGLRGIQAGLMDPTSSVFASTDLPAELERSAFTGDGFFQALFQTPCGYFRQDTPLTGSVSSVEVRQEAPALR